MNNRSHANSRSNKDARPNHSNAVAQRRIMRRRHRAATMASLGIQPAGLKVGAANDKYEKEADKVAEHVVNSPGPAGGGISQGAGGAQRGMDRTAGRNREVDRDEDANILTKRLQRGVKDATDDVTDDEKDVANKSPLQRMIGRDASETQAQRTMEPEDPEGKINKKPIEISRMPGAKGDEDTDAMKMHDDSGYRAGEPSASEMGQRMPKEEAAPESDSEMMDGQTSRLQRMGEDDLQEKPMAQRDAVKGYDDEAKMKPLAQRECATCGQEAKRTVQRREGKKPRNGAFTASNNVSREVKAMKNSGGQPLPASERAYLEPRFGRDLSHVRLHTGDRAAKTSQAIDAKAFTVGNNIAFNKGYYKPGTHEGRKLLAHEITHTIQQTGGAKKGARGQARGVNREVVQRDELSPHGPTQVRQRRQWGIKQIGQLNYTVYYESKDPRAPDTSKTDHSIPIHSRNSNGWLNFLQKVDYQSDQKKAMELHAFMALAVGGDMRGFRTFNLSVTKADYKGEAPSRTDAQNLMLAIFMKGNFDTFGRNGAAKNVLHAFTKKYGAETISKSLPKHRRLGNETKPFGQFAAGTYTESGGDPMDLVVQTLAAAGNATHIIDAGFRKGKQTLINEGKVKLKNAATAIASVLSAIEKVNVDNKKSAMKVFDYAAGTVLIAGALIGGPISAFAGIYGSITIQIIKDIIDKSIYSKDWAGAMSALARAQEADFFNGINGQTNRSDEKWDPEKFHPKTAGAVLNTFTISVHK